MAPQYLRWDCQWKPLIFHRPVLQAHNANTAHGPCLNWFCNVAAWQREALEDALRQLYVLDAIDANELEVHSSLPSVNNLIEYLGYARETFAKAYRDLIAHGVVESKNRKGYFVVSNNTQLKQKVAVLLYAYDTFQDTLVSELRANLPEEVTVDLFFHHNNMIRFLNG